MNENYLNYILTASGMTMNYPLWTTIGETFYNDADLVIPVKRKEVSFIKKKIPKFEFQSIPKVLTVNLENIEDVEYFKERLLSSLKLPSWFMNSSYGIISDPTSQIFDEFH